MDSGANQSLVSGGVAHGEPLPRDADALFMQESRDAYNAVLGDRRKVEAGEPVEGAEPVEKPRRRSNFRPLR